MVHETDANGAIRRVNDLFCLKTGYAAEELVGGTHHKICPDLAEQASWIGLHRAEEGAGQQPLTGQTLNQTKDGSELWLSTTISPVYDESGSIAGYHCASLDVSEAVKLRKDFEQSSKLMQLGQLTATVAHEIRNPLGAIRTAVFVLERRLKGKVDGVETQLDRINNGIRRCDKIITELLDFSRKKSLSLQTLDVNGWVAEVLQEECRALPHGTSISYQPSSEPIEACFDPDQMRQVLVNLINNAGEAMSEKVASEASGVAYVPELRISTARHGEFVEITVADNGPGIDEKNLKRIREPLFTTKSFGVGLGVPAIEKILQNHGGGLGVESIFGAGATMTARFLVEHH